MPYDFHKSARNARTLFAKINEGGTASMVNVDQLPEEGDLKLLYKLPDGSVWSYYEYEEEGVINKGYSRLDNIEIVIPECTPSLISVDSLPTGVDKKFLYKLPDGSIWSYYDYKSGNITKKGYLRLDNVDIVIPEYTPSMVNVETLPTTGDKKTLYKLPDGSIWSYYEYESEGVINKGYSRLDDPKITPPEDIPAMQAFFDTEGNLNIECESAYFDSEGNLVIEDSVSYFDEEGNLVIEDGGSKTINYVIEPSRKTKGSLLSYDGEKYISSNALPYLTTAPTSANPNGLILVVLDSEPAKKYEGYIYIIGGE